MYSGGMRISWPRFKRRVAFRRYCFALSLRDRALHHLAVHIESHRLDMPVLLAAKKVPGAAQLQVERGDSEARSEIAELLQSAASAGARSP